MLEVLHLDAARNPVAVLLEGPALRLRRSGLADVFAPLPRLARVLVHGTRVQWRTEALLACAQSGVPILFLEPRGRLAAVLAPVAPPAVRSDLAALLDAAATRPGFRGQLEDFCRAELRRAALAALRAEGCAAPRDMADLRPRALRERWLRRSPAPTHAQALQEMLCGLCAALVAEGLCRQGVGQQFLVGRSGAFPLPDLLGEALGLPLSLALSRMAVELAAAGHAAGSAAARRAVIRLCERSALAAPRDRMLARLAMTLAAEP